MRLELANTKAIRFACLNFHYAKRLPAQPMVGWSVFNDAGEWCGCIVFNNGIMGIEKPFRLAHGQVSELIRVALNGKQQETSRCVSLALKMFKNHCPLVKIVVSYADSDYSHIGTIYQATNFFYLGSVKTSDQYICPKTGKSLHSRGHSASGVKKQFGAYKKVPKTETLIRIKKGTKHKYAIGLTKPERERLSKIGKPYPKKCVQSIDGDAPDNQLGEGGSIPT